MLSDDQLHLLHAWVDGELHAADSQAVMELLTRPEASEYVSELRRLRELVAKHAGVRAPTGLFERVRDAIREESREGRLFDVHIWRVATLAAAAAVLIAFGVALAPIFYVPESAPLQPVAQLPSPLAPVVREAGPAPDKIVPVAHAAIEADKEIERRPASVLRLDRGVDQPLELSMLMDRSRDASNLQVYNDMLIVSSLYGDAELKDGESRAEEFAGRDFSEFEGVEIEIEAERVPDLIAALNRMAADQAYGEVVVPADLRQSIDSSAARFTELQRASRGPQPPDTDEMKGLGGSARGYLPPALQRDCLEQELKDLPEKVRLGKLEARVQPETTKGASESRKIKLVLRLR